MTETIDTARDEGATMIFLHGLKAKDSGKTYIVSIAYEEDMECWLDGPLLTPAGVQHRGSFLASFNVTVVSTGIGLLHPQSSSILCNAYLIRDSREGGLLRFRRPEATPGDPSSFVIPYTFGDREGRLTGTLLNRTTLDLRAEIPSALDLP
jgi:hypothetical protein